MSYRPLPPIREDLNALQRRLRQAVDLRVKARLHLRVCTCASAPARLHLRVCTCSS